MRKKLIRNMAAMLAVSVVIPFTVTACAVKFNKTEDETSIGTTEENTTENNTTEENTTKTTEGDTTMEELTEPAIVAANGLTLYERTSTEIPESFMIDKPVRIERNGANQCYAYCIAMILRYYGEEDANGQAVFDSIPDRPADDRADPSTVLKYFDSRDDYDATIYTGTIDDLKDSLNKGIPVIILGKMSKEEPELHYMTVTGYDEDYFYIADSYLFELENDYYNRKVDNNYFKFMWDTEIQGFTHIFIEVDKVE